jgi:beta-phosphoglucomutase
MASPQAVIFDVDGVLVDSYQAHFQSFRAMLEELGTEFTESQFRATFGRTTRDIVAELHDGKMTDEEIRDFDDRKEALYRDIVRKDFPAIDGAADLVEMLADSGFAMAVGSSGPPENVQLTLDSLACGKLFSAQVTGGDVTRGKPDPQVFLLAAQRLGVSPGRCAVVEDAPAGVEAANRAEMASIALVGTATRDQLSHARLVVDSLRELSPSIIAKMING